ncbi:MAG: hypothetical protein ACYDBB_05595 [Armatimonadota bacterium]
MRTGVLHILCGVFALVIAGCSSLPITQPMMTLPIQAAGVTFPGSDHATPNFAVQSVNMSSEDHWVRAASYDTAFDSLGIQLQATNETGNAENPSPVTLRLFVSEQQNLLPETVAGNGAFIMEVNLPAGERELHYASDDVPVSQEAARIMNDGRFFLYSIGDPAAIHLQASTLTLQLNARMSVL